MGNIPAARLADLVLARKKSSGADLGEGPFPEVPWLHEEVVDWLDKIVTAESHVLEIGGGGSTIWLARRTPHVTTIEHNPQWCTELQAHLQKCSLSAQILYRPDYPKEGFTLGKTFDIVIVDGEGYTRPLQIACALPFIRPGGWLIVDDAHRANISCGFSQITGKLEFEYQDPRWREKTMAWRF